MDIRDAIEAARDDDDAAAIQQGLAELAAGEVSTLDEVRASLIALGRIRP